MRSSCAMMVTSITPPLKEERAEVDGAEEARGVAISVHGHFGRSWASLRLTDRANGTYDGEVKRLGIRDRGVANDPRDSRRKDKLITGRCISVNIHERENEMRGKVYSKDLNEGK